MSKSLSLDGRVPIVVAVSGHRDLYAEDEKALEDHVRARLEHLSRHLPHTPIVVLTGLAEGADRVGARAALALRKALGGRRSPTSAAAASGRAPAPAANPEERQRVFVVGLLARPREAFERSFQCTRPDEFQRLLDSCDAWHELPALEGLSDWPELSEGGPDIEGYRRLAAFLARSAHVLIALSESECPDEPALDPLREAGGTATVMSFFAHGVPAAYAPGTSLLDPSPAEHPCPSGCRPHTLIRIPVRRRGQALCDARPPAEPPPAVPDWTLFDEDAPRQSPLAHWCRYCWRSVRTFFRHEDENRDEFAPRHLMARIERFNRDCDELLPAAGDTPAEGPLPGFAGEELEPYASTYRAADRLSKWVLRPRYRERVRAVVVLTLVAVLCFESYVHILHGWKALLSLWFALLLTLAVLAVRLRHDLLDERDQVYRSLAEALRVQAAWRLAGLGRNAGNDYSRHLQNEVAWVRSSLRALAGCAGAPPAGPARERLRRVLESWIVPQRAYFRKTCVGGRRLEHYWHEWFVFAFVGGLVLTLLASLAEHAPQPQLIGLATFALASAGLVHAESRRRALQPLMRRYEHQDPVFARAERLLKKLLARDSFGPAEERLAHEILRDLGVAALNESTSWLLTKRNRPLEIHFH